MHGAYLGGQGNWVMDSWTEKGENQIGISDSLYDLVEVKPRIKKTIWVNVFEDAHGNTTTDSCGSRVSADIYASKHSWKRIACVELNIDCEIGEGLNDD